METYNVRIEGTCALLMHSCKIEKVIITCF